MEQVACAQCGELHDLSRMEPNQRRPDALLSVPEDERGTATFESKKRLHPLRQDSQLAVGTLDHTLAPEPVLPARLTTVRG